ncbi:hypothetical protein ACFFTN_21020 [Aminobacter aganoensis]|uniref:Uncharacterized protein n=1 Tax=Aminobacter aganoensis TaxID=83264 RepID=A0A7X0FC48_9HYPH|nr:hypothetical protein [Aminobacter aganoensis]MBB6356951.1 hypothetical protein [Aminobacter aganoensis]
MATLNINGQRVKVDDSFLSLTPEQQNATVDEIAASLGQSGTQPEGLRSELSGITQQLDSLPASEPQTFGGASQTWAEHAIGDIPIIGPALQTGSDYLGTEIMGRLGGQDPAQMRGKLWKRREDRTKQYPLSSMSGALAGNIAATGAAGATATGARALGMTGGFGARVGNSALSSGAINSADTLIRGGSAEDAINSGATGAVIGGAIPIVGGAIRQSLGAVGNKVAPTLGAIRNAPKEAERRVGRVMQRDMQADASSMLNASDEAVARQAGVPLLNADRGGEATRALARSVANQSPEARATIERTANDRFAGQSTRATAFVKDLMGGAVDDLGYQQAIKETARRVNKPAYDAALKAPGAQAMWHEGFEQLMQAPAMQAAARQATTRGANRAVVEGFAPVRNPFAYGPDGRMTLARDPKGNAALPNLAFWDQVKRNLDGMIGKVDRSGDSTMSADLKALKSHLVSMLDSAVPQYKNARMGAAGYFGAEDAIEAGKKFANSPRLIPETKAAYLKFTPAERAGFATGYASELIDRIRASGDRANVINQVFKSQASRESMEVVFGPQKMRQIEAYVRVEDLADRLRGAMGNSTTARQLVELGIGAGSGFAISGGDWKGALTGAAAAKGVRHVGQRIDDRIMQQIATLLMSSDPTALSRATANAALSPSYMQALEHMGNMLSVPVRGAAMAVQ